MVTDGVKHIFTWVKPSIPFRDKFHSFLFSLHKHSWLPTTAACTRLPPAAWLPTTRGSSTTHWHPVLPAPTTTYGSPADDLHNAGGGGRGLPRLSRWNPGGRLHTPRPLLCHCLLPSWHPLLPGDETETMPQLRCHLWMIAATPTCQSGTQEETSGLSSIDVIFKL